MREFHGENPNDNPAAGAPPRPRTTDDIDMTPMIDVTFLLLIFFMVTAAFALQKAIMVPPIPEDDAASVQSMSEVERDSVVIRIDDANIFWVAGPGSSEEQRAASSLEMRAKVREAQRSGTGTITKLLVQAHAEATHEKLIDALDAGSSIRMEQIRLMVYEEGDL